MNLALLDPFRRQIPDRIDSTLTIPRALHPSRYNKKDSDGATTSEAADAVGSGKGRRKTAKTPKTAKIPRKPKTPKSAVTASSSSKSSSKLFKQNVKLKKSKGEDAERGEVVDIEKVKKSEIGGGDDVEMEDDSISQQSNRSEKGGERDDMIKPIIEKSNNSINDGGGGAMQQQTDGDDDTEMKDVGGEAEDDENTESSTPLKKKRKKKKLMEDTSSPSSQPMSVKGVSTPRKSKKSATDAEKYEADDDDDDAMEEYWTACYAVSFNRRGSLLASGHASGLVPCHDFMSRTVSALYSPPPGITIEEGKNNASIGADVEDAVGVEEKQRGGKTQGSEKKIKHEMEVQPDVSMGTQPIKAEMGSESGTDASEKSSSAQLAYLNGVTSISWDRHSRTLLAGAIGDRNLRLMDNTHPQVCLDCTEAVRRQYISGGGATPSATAGGDDDSLFTPEGKKSRDSFSMMSPPIVTSVASPASRKKKTKDMGLSTPQMLQQHQREQLAKSGSKESSLNEENSDEPIQIRLETVSFGKARLLRGNVILPTKNAASSHPSGKAVLPPKAHFSPPPSPVGNNDKSATIFKKGAEKSSPVPVVTVPAMRHSTLLMELPQPLGGPAQLHPRDNHVGLACMIDGSLALFWMPPLAFYETFPSLASDFDKSHVGSKAKSTGKSQDTSKNKAKLVQDILDKEEASRVGNVVYLVPPPEAKKRSLDPAAPSTRRQYFVTCAAFGKNGSVLYAVTKCGTLLGYRLSPSLMKILRGESSAALASSLTRPSLYVKVPGGAAAWQIIVSRNGKSLIINSADCALRLYDTNDLNEAFAAVPVLSEAPELAAVKPRFTFQDLVSKAPWASCDFSGDCEYVVGGCNSYPQPGDNYQLFLWNTVTGDLLDQLTGPQVSLYSLSCHPTRPFIAVGTSDGLVDIWGPRLDWTAFAPDFQALQQNVLYAEREDEFDVVIDGEEGERNIRHSADSLNATEEDDDVDIITVAKVPAFDSDSEEEDEVFCFDCKVMKMHMHYEKPGPKRADHE